MRALPIAGGTLRVKFDRGWTSVTAKSGKVLLELLEEARAPNAIRERAQARWHATVCFHIIRNLETMHD